MDDVRGVLSIGIWLEASFPADFRTGGLGRLMGALLSALAARREDTKVTVALAAWSTQSFHQLLDDFRIPHDRIRLVASRPHPQFFARWRPETAVRFDGLRASAWASPRKTSDVLEDVARRLRYRLRRLLFDREFSRLARQADACDVDCWLVPAPTSDHAALLNAPIVVVVPDLAYVEFPELFSAALIDDIDRRARRTVGRAAQIVTYSRHVADLHAANHLGIEARKIHVIPHAPFDALAALEAASPPGMTVRDRAANVLHAYLKERAKEQPSWAGAASVAFDEMRFLFVTTQVRATKNFLNFFAAFARLASRRRDGLKLVMTGSLDDRIAGESVRSHLRATGIDGDVLSLTGLPSSVHAACLALAQLTVVPTLFEGGFPFPFAESLSAGTPAILSDIPVVREVIPEAVRPHIVFDPRDAGEIAERIAWALDHRAELLAIERPVYAELCRRDWRQVAGSYREVLREAADGRRGQVG